MGLGGLAQRLAELRGWRRSGVALAAGVLSVLAMPPFFLWPVLMGTIPVLVWMLDGTKGEPSPRRFPTRATLLSAFAVGWWFGFGYFLAGLFWIGEAFLVEAEIFAWLLPFAVTLMPAGLALFFGAVTAAAQLAWHPGVIRIVALAVTFGIAEWLRGHILTGFPWNVLGYALTPTLTMMQAAGVVGIYGLTLWTIVVVASPAVLAVDGLRVGRAARGFGLGVALAAVPLTAQLAYGAWRLSTGPAPVVQGTMMRIVQPSIPQRDKWRPELQRQIFNEHVRLSGTAADGRVDGLAGVTHVLWPEAAMPFLPLASPEALSAIGEMLPDDAYLISGALRIEPPAAPGALRRAYNSMMVFDGAGRLVTLYDKIHLVPFGEYLPLQPLLESIGLQQLTRMRGGFEIGSRPRPLVWIPGLPAVGGLICYEAIFPTAVVQGSERPGLLVNITNDGWFGNTTGPRQHFHQARVRAVEEGLPLVRAANNGISAVIDAEGRIVARLDLNEKGVIDAAIPGRRPPPPYARLGDLLFVFNTLLFITLIAWCRRLRCSPKVDARDLRTYELQAAVGGTTELDEAGG